MAESVALILAESGIKTHGACFNEKANKFLRDNHNPRNEAHGGTARLFADIEMLRKGKEFFGLFHSNLVRMVHRLRYPHLGHSHALALETFPPGPRRSINDNMFDIPWVD